MSVSRYRNTVARLNKELADLNKRASEESVKVARYKQEIAQVMRSITTTTSVATRRSKERQIESKRRQLVQAQKREADYRSQHARILGELNRNLESLARVETQEARRQEQDEKRRRQEEIRHSQQLTRDLQERARLSAELAKHRYVIDLATLPTKITVLFLASNPVDQVPLRLDEEVRAISAKLRAADYREAVELRHAWAVRPGDILQALNEHKPQVVHFSGHGSDNEHLVFQGDTGGTKLVSRDAIAATIATLSDNICLVVFNACFSGPQAEAVTEHIDFAIGMTDAIGDEAARVFAAQLYSAIGFGLSLRRAFNQAVAALKLEGIPEDQTPQLYRRDGLDPDVAILVRPAEGATDAVPAD